MKYGFLESQLNEVIKIFSRYKEIDEAVLFGSRAIDTFKEASDVDIAVKGKTVSHKFISDLKFYFEEETDLPFFFDFVSYPKIENKNLKKHIDKYGVTIYRKGWRKVKLGELGVDIIDGDRGKNYPKKKDFSINGYCLFLNTKNVTESGFSFSDLNFITKQKDKLLRKGKLQRGDVILTTRGTVGNIAYYKNSVPFENIRINSGMVIIRPKGINKNFNHQLFKYLKEDFKNYTSGSAQPQLPIRDLRQMETNLPPLSEQKMISEVLSSLDDKIELLQKQNKTLEEIAQTLFRKWFIQDAKPHWPEKPLGELLEIIESGSRPKGGIDPDLKEGIPSIGAESINGIGRFDFSKTKYVTGEFFKNMKKGIVKDYDILIYKDGAYIGKKAMFGNDFPFKKMSVNEHVFILRANSKANQFFLYFSLEQKKLSKLNANSAQPGLNQKAMKSLEIIIPPKDIMNNFRSIVKPWIDKILFNSNQIRTLDNLRDILLPKLISGAVRVKYY